MNDVVDECDYEHPDWSNDFAAAIGFALEGFFREEALQYILSKSGE